MFGRIYQLLATTLLFAIDGHLLLVRGFMTSFDAVGTTGFDMQDVTDLLIHSFTHVLRRRPSRSPRPLLAALFLTEVVLGLLSRAAPQMNVSRWASAQDPRHLLLAGVAIPLLPDAVNNLAPRGSCRADVRRR